MKLMPGGMTPLARPCRVRPMITVWAGADRGARRADGKVTRWTRVR
ncbi:hypothetical protein FrEUN1fDRAFT_1547 [Parafrankia sp. EUN1f]|nr:hypothetical protein FrEUN1fDRAFT_1547 [Parafrankia sp. EUN1f]